MTKANAESPRNFHLTQIDRAAGREILFPAVKARLPIEDLCPVRTQHEVARIMGISAARVCQHERSAMRRLQKCLSPFHPGNGDEAVVVAPRMRRFRAGERESVPAPCRWLRVTKLTGNRGFPLAAVCFAFNELRSIHEEDYRPPIVVGNQVGYICIAAMDEGCLSVGVRLAGSGQTVSRIGSCSAELQVEIIHDIPVIAAGVVASEPLQGLRKCPAGANLSPSQNAGPVACFCE